jgi:hypothetical protein
MESVMQSSDKGVLDPLQTAVDTLQSKKIHWWNATKIVKTLIKSFFIQNHRIKILETQISFEAEALQNMLSAIQLQQKQIALLNEGRKNG